jgi:hypothetical protein
MAASDQTLSLSWPGALAGGVLSGVFGAPAVAFAACAALVIWALVTLVPRGAILIPGALACWAALLVLLLR